MTPTPNNPADIIEARDVTERLTAAGLGRLVDVMLTHPDIYFERSGKLNVSRLARYMAVDKAEAGRLLERAREVLGPNI